MRSIEGIKVWLIRVMLDLQSDLFQWLATHDPVPVNCSHHNLTHSVMRIFRRCANGPSRGKFNMQTIHVIHVYVAKPIVRTQRARVHVIRALAQHYPNAIPLDQSPI